MFKKSLFLLIILLFITACGKDEEPKVAQQPTHQQQSTIIEKPDTPKPPSVSQSKPAPVKITVKSTSKADKILAEMKAGYLLKPDKRFLLAIADIDNFLTGRGKSYPTVEFQNDRWTVHYKDKYVGSLTELPDFSEFLTVLSSWSNTLLIKNPIDLSNFTAQNKLHEIDTKLELFLEQHTKEALVEIDTLWRNGNRSKELLLKASRGLTWLTIQELNKTEMGDAVPAKALAMLALSKALAGKETLIQEEVLLADHMQYSAHAMQQADNLPQFHPVRLYSLRDYSGLQKSIENTSSTPLSKYLRLKQLVELRDLDGWNAFFEQYLNDDIFSLSVLKTSLDMDTFSMNRFYSNYMPGFILSQVKAETDQLFSFEDIIKFTVKGYEKLNPIVGQMVATMIEELIALSRPKMLIELHQELEKLSSKYQGPFLDHSLLKTYYISYLYSCFYTQGIFYLDELSSIDGVKEFQDDFAKTTYPQALEFIRWYGNIAASKDGQKDIYHLEKDISLLQHFGSPLLNRSFEEYEKHMKYGDSRLFPVARKLAAKLDSRAEHRDILDSIAYSSLIDLPLKEKLCSSIIQIDPANSDFDKIWLAKFQEDLPALKRYADSPTLRPKYRAQAIEYLGKIESVDTSANTISAYQKLLQENPENWKVNRRFVKFLIKKKEFVKARSVATAWLKRDVTTGGLENLVMREQVAKSYLLEGEYEKGLEYIEPYIRGMKGDTLDIAAKLMAKLGMHEKAEETFLMARDRYPDSRGTFLSHIEYIWQSGRYEEAAEELKHWKYTLSGTTWQDSVSNKFHKTFIDNEQGARLAFGKLLKAGISHWYLKYIPYDFWAKNSQLAFELSNQLSAKGLGKFDFLISSYRYLRDSKGKKTALQWFRDKTSAKRLNAASMFFYNRDAYDLLWEVIIKPEHNGRYADFTWLMRAAAWAKDGAKDDERKHKLIVYYTANNRSFYQHLGSYLMNLDSGATLFEQADKKDKLCELSYYTALKEWSMGNYHIASDWYHVTLSTRMDKEGEYRWAFDDLKSWYRKGRSLSVLQQRGQL